VRSSTEHGAAPQWARPWWNVLWARQAPVQGATRHHGAAGGGKESRCLRLHTRCTSALIGAPSLTRSPWLDAQRVLRGERAIAHEAVALHALIEWLTRLARGEPARVAGALEVPRGAVVDPRLARGFHVVALNPKQLARFRDRDTVAGAKDARRDASVLAPALATAQPAFRPREPADPLISELREWSRVEDERREEWGASPVGCASNSTEFIRRRSPSVRPPTRGGFGALGGLAPTPAAALRLRRAAVVTLRRAHRIRRLPADQVLAALQSPSLRVAPGTVTAASAHVALLIPRLELVDRQRRDCAQRIERRLDALAPTGEHQGYCDVTILRSMRAAPYEYGAPESVDLELFLRLARAQDDDRGARRAGPERSRSAPGSRDRRDHVPASAPAHRGPTYSRVRFALPPGHLVSRAEVWRTGRRLPVWTVRRTWVRQGHACFQSAALAV